jgi:short/branched chain acyl-CoA dehydrogenase
MGIETSSEHGGAEASFTSAILAIEELAKIDPSVSVLCDVHNTLVNTIFRTYATEEQQQKWLPQLAQEKVCLLWRYACRSLSLVAGMLLPVRASKRK